MISFGFIGFLHKGHFSLIYAYFIIHDQQNMCPHGVHDVFYLSNKQILHYLSEFVYEIESIEVNFYYLLYFLYFNINFINFIALVIKIM